MDSLDLPTVQRTLKHLLQHHSSKASILWCSAFFTVQLSQSCMTTGKSSDYMDLCLQSDIFVYIHIFIPLNIYTSIQFCSVTQSCPTLCNPRNHSTPGLPVHHQLPEFTQTHVHRVSDAIQPSHPLSSPSPPVPNPSQHQGLFQCVNSFHEVVKVLEFHL